MPDIVSMNTDNASLVRAIRVMIVDDHKAFLGSLRSLFETCTNFRVVAESGSCQQALAIAIQSPLDLIFMDRFLPDGDSLQIIRTLRQSCPHTQIVIYAGILEEDALLQALLLGASGYLTKEILMSHLETLLQGFLRGELVMTSALSTRVIQLFIQKMQEQEQLLQSAVYFHSDEEPLPSFTPIVTTYSEASEALSLKVLTPQENNVFGLLSQGYSNKQIASQLAISPYTVGKHVQHILQKLGVSNRTQAVSSYPGLDGRTHPGSR